MTMTAISLFAGIGGFDIALESAGIKVVGACEIDPQARGVLKARYPETQLFEDVCNVTIEELSASGFVGERGVIVGGFPCQDLSVAGKRAGLAGARSGLFWEICRLASGSQAKWIILENVPGLLSSNGGRDMGVVLGALVELGYGISYRVLDAQHFGVPQRRRRVFIVGCLGDDGRASSEVLDLIEGRSRYLETSRASGKDSPESSAKGSRTGGRVLGSDIIGTLTASDARGIRNETVEMNKLVVESDPVIMDNSWKEDVRIVSNGISPTVTARWGTGGGNVPMLTTPFVKSRRAQSVDDEETWVEDGPAPTLNRMDNSGESRATVLAVIQDARGMDKAQNGIGVTESDVAYTLDRVSEQGVAVAYSIREDAKANNFSATEIDTARALQAVQPGVQSHHAQTFIVDQDSSVAYDEYNDSIGETHQTLRAGTKQSTGAIQGSVVRRLTPTECERLQGFPDGWTRYRYDMKKDCIVEQADSSRYKQLGNAVAVPVVTWIAHRLAEFDRRLHGSD